MSTWALSNTTQTPAQRSQNLRPQTNTSAPPLSATTQTLLSTHSQSELFFLPNFQKKYLDFKGRNWTLDQLLAWIEKESKNVIFDKIRVDRWPDLQQGLRKEDVKKNVTLALRNFEDFFGQDHPLAAKVIDVFQQLYSLLLIDQKADTSLLKNHVPFYLFGNHLQGVVTILYPDQVVIASDNSTDSFELMYSKNLGRRFGFSVFRNPKDGEYQNEFYALPLSKSPQILDANQFAFCVIDLDFISPSSANIYIQNKILALQDSITKYKIFKKQSRFNNHDNIQGGVVIIKGIASPEVLNWLIQRNVQEVPRCPDVEVVAWINLDVTLTLKNQESTFSAPYFITIKPAHQFRWKKDNINRIQHHAVSPIIFQLKKNTLLTGAQKRELKKQYLDAKTLIKENLKWIPAHEIFIQMKQTASENTDLSKLFWHMVRQKERRSGFDPIPIKNFLLFKTVTNSLEINTDEMNKYLIKEIKNFISWIVNMANNCPDDVPESVRVLHF